MSSFVAALAKALAMVTPAEQAFHCRWRMSSLKRLDAGLWDAVTDQQELYGSACVMGESKELEIHAAAMVRGWNAACKAMETAQWPEDAYLMGMDDESGIQVVIAEHKGSRDALAKRYGEPLVLMTPNEVATLLATVKLLQAAKLAFPDAEIISYSQGQAA